MNEDYPDLNPPSAELNGSTTISIDLERKTPIDPAVVAMMMRPPIRMSELVCPTCRGARHLQNDVTGEIIGCPQCNAGRVDESLRPGKRWA